MRRVFGGQACLRHVFDGKRCLRLVIGDQCWLRRAGRPLFSHLVQQPFDRLLAECGKFRLHVSFSPFHCSGQERSSQLVVCSCLATSKLEHKTLQFAMLLLREFVAFPKNRNSLDVPRLDHGRLFNAQHVQ